MRHTTPDVAKGVCYGQADVNVTATFEKELERLKPHIPGRAFRAFSSPLQRCRKMADSIGKPYQIDDRLKEMSYGNWELSPWNEIDQMALNQWMEDFVNRRPPSGESFQDLKHRVTDFWDELTTPERDEICVLYTHGGVIRTIICHLLFIPLEKVFNFHLDFGSITKIARHNNQYRVEYLNR